MAGAETQNGASREDYPPKDFRNFSVSVWKSRMYRVLWASLQNGTAGEPG